MSFWNRKKDLGQDFESCVKGTKVLPPEDVPEWSPMTMGVQIYVAGDTLSAIKSRALIVMDVQAMLVEQFKKDMPETSLMLRVNTALDRCEHATGWSSEPVNIQENVAAWHCYVSRRDYASSFQGLYTEAEPVDLVIMMGSNPEDKFLLSEVEAGKLHEIKGTQIFALTDQSNPYQQACQKITDAAGGLTLPMPASRQDIVETVREIAQIVTYSLGNRKALPAPANLQLADLRDRIQKIPDNDNGPL